MAQTVLTSALIARIRKLADVQSGPWPDSSILVELQAAYNAYYRAIIARDRDAFLSSGNISVVSGTNTYNMPSDFWILRGVEVLDGSNYYSLARFLFSERNLNQASGNVKAATRYRVTSQTLILAPTPSWSGTVRVWYIQAPSTLTLPSVRDASIETFAGWDEMITLWAVRSIKQQQEEDISQIDKRIDEVRASILEITSQDSAEPDRVRDVDAETLQRDLAKWGTA